MLFERVLFEHSKFATRQPMNFAEQSQYFPKLKKQRHIYALWLSIFGRAQISRTFCKRTGNLLLFRNGHSSDSCLPLYPQPQPCEAFQCLIERRCAIRTIRPAKGPNDRQRRPQLMASESRSNRVRTSAVWTCFVRSPAWPKVSVQESRVVPR